MEAVQWVHVELGVCEWCVGARLHGGAAANGWRCSAADAASAPAAAAAPLTLLRRVTQKTLQHRNRGMTTQVNHCVSWLLPLRVERSSTDSVLLKVSDWVPNRAEKTA
jgi:hypothetical protein